MTEASKTNASTPAVFDFDAIGKRIGQSEDQAAAQPFPGDEILGLFRLWRPRLARLNREWGEAAADQEKFLAESAEVTALERRIFDAPVRDAQGLAVKAFMIAHIYADGRAPDGEPVLAHWMVGYDCEGHLRLDLHALKGLVEGLIKFLPEAEPLCKDMLSAMAAEVA